MKPGRRTNDFSIARILANENSAEQEKRSWSDDSNFDRFPVSGKEKSHLKNESFERNFQTSGTLFGTTEETRNNWIRKGEIIGDDKYLSNKIDFACSKSTGEDEIKLQIEGDICENSGIASVKSINTNKTNTEDESPIKLETNLSKKLLENSKDADVEERRNDFARDTFLRKESMERLAWLRYTRYKPPKIPRRASMASHKIRKPSLHPRIPFSSSQIDFLEKKFCTSAYLMKDDVMEISAALKLPANRVKIWFQNRRARERRETSNNTETNQSTM